MIVPKFHELRRLRDAIGGSGEHTWNEYARVAAGAVGTADIDLLKAALHIGHGSNPDVVAFGTWRADNAGHAALALFSRAGFTDLSSEIRQWLLLPQDPGDQIYISGPSILAGCVQDAFDGSALRVLFECQDSDNASVAIELNRLLRRDVALASLLECSRRDQLERLIRLPKNKRRSSLLKRFAKEAEGRDALEAAAAHGDIFALVSLLFCDSIVPQPLFLKVEPQSDDERQLVINAAIENVSRGGDAQFHGFALRSKLGSDAEEEFLAEISHQ